MRKIIKNRKSLPTFKKADAAEKISILIYPLLPDS